MAIETQTNASTISKHYVSVPKYYLIALGELGVREVAGDKANPRIVEYAASTTLKATSDEVAWCASFLGWCLRHGGCVSTGSAAAKSYLNWGVKVGLEFSKWSVGDVMVFTRDGGGHVAMFSGEKSADGLTVTVVGGNQTNAVTLAKRNVADLLDVRRVS